MYLYSLQFMCKHTFHHTQHATIVTHTHTYSHHSHTYMYVTPIHTHTTTTTHTHMPHTHTHTHTCMSLPYTHTTTTTHTHTHTHTHVQHHTAHLHDNPSCGARVSDNTLPRDDQPFPHSREYFSERGKGHLQRLAHLPAR